MSFFKLRYKHVQSQSVWKRFAPGVRINHLTSVVNLQVWMWSSFASRTLTKCTIHSYFYMYFFT